MKGYREIPVTFDCQGDRLVGIVSRPGEDGASRPESALGVVIVVGGPQYRAGSHRQFVSLARALARAGTPVLRFDYRGMGDSEGARTVFEGASDDIRSAIDALQAAVRSVRHIVLWGLCDGASAALLYCHATNDTRIRGLCLLNPWVRSEASHAQTQVKHYYTQRLRQKEFWLKLLSGKVAVGAIGGLMQSAKRALSKSGLEVSAEGALPYQLAMAQAWHGFTGPMLLILSGEDYTAKEFLEQIGAEPAWSQALSKGGLTRYDCLGADHTFSNGDSQESVEAQMVEWVRGCE